MKTNDLGAIHGRSTIYTTRWLQMASVTLARMGPSRRARASACVSMFSPDVRRVAVSNGNVEDPIVLERLIRRFDFPMATPTTRTPVSLRHEFGGLWE